MSGSVLQAYLEAIHTKVPELIEKEEIGEGVQGEVGLSNKIVQGDLELMSGKSCLSTPSWLTWMLLSTSIQPRQMQWLL